MLLATLCWVSFDGLAFHPGGGGGGWGSSNISSHFILGVLWWTGIPFTGM